MDMVIVIVSFVSFADKKDVIYLVWPRKKFVNPFSCRHRMDAIGCSACNKVVPIKLSDEVWVRCRSVHGFVELGQKQTLRQFHGFTLKKLVDAVVIDNKGNSKTNTKKWVYVKTSKNQGQIWGQIKKGANRKYAVNAFNCWWSHLSSQEGYSSFVNTDFLDFTWFTLWTILVSFVNQRWKLDFLGRTLVQVLLGPLFWIVICRK